MAKAAAEVNPSTIRWIPAVSSSAGSSRVTTSATGEGAQRTDREYALDPCDPTPLHDALYVPQQLLLEYVW